MIPQTPTEMLREVLGTINDHADGIAEGARRMNIEAIKRRFAALERSMKVLEVIECDIMKPRDGVVHCANCEHCMSLEMVDPMKPYSGNGEGFFCMRWDNEFYAPAYRAETWFCADGIPRKEGEDGMK